MDRRSTRNQLGIAPAPDWMVQRMDSSATTAASSGDSVLERLSSRCEVFATAWEAQRQGGLDEETWFKWCSLLVRAASFENALQFSSASTKHNLRSETRLQELRKSEKKQLVRCRTLGCNEEKIAKCFSGNLRRNDAGHLVNSPGAFLKPHRLAASSVNPSKPVDLSDIGLEISNKTDRLTGINGNVYSRYILQRKLDLVYSHDQFYVYEKGVWRFKDTNAISRILRGILHSFVPDSWTPMLEGSYMSALRVEAPRVDKMDPDRRLINLLNGMLDLRTYQLVDHDKKYHSTVQVPIRYDPNARCPMFLQFLADVFQGDQELIDLAAEMLGYCLTVEVKAQKAFILYGKGSNGKSVLADILKKLCGSENVSSVSLKELDDSFARSEIVDKLLNLATENEVGKAGLDTTYFKSIVAGESIRVEKKHEQGFTYEPFCKLVFALNNLPYTKDKSYGFVRRLIIIPFNRTFTETDANVELMDDLTEELPGILNFAIEGLKRLEANRYVFTKSKASNELLKEYMEELNPVECFVEEMIVKGGPEDRVKNKTIGETFRLWCQEQGHSALAQYSQIRLIRNIKDVLKSKGISVGNGNAGNGRYLTGIKMNRTPHSILSGNAAVDEVDDIDDIAIT